MGKPRSHDWLFECLLSIGLSIGEVELRFDLIPMNFLKLGQLVRESMTERAFGPQLFEQVLGGAKGIGSKIAILEQSGPTPRNFAFG